MKKYEIRQTTQEEVQKFHEEHPLAVFEDEHPIKFCHNQDEAEDLKREAEGYQLIEEKLEQFVRDMFSQTDLVEYEIWQIIHEISGGPPREV